MSPGAQSQKPQNIFSDTEAFQTPAVLFHDSHHVNWIGWGTLQRHRKMLLGLDPRSDTDPARSTHRVVSRSVPIQRSHPPAGPQTVAEQQLHGSAPWSNARTPPLDHIQLQNRSSTAAPHGHPSQASEMLLTKLHRDYIQSY